MDRSEQHRRNVAELPCAECGIEGWSQCAHSNSAEYGKGARIKSNDFASFPLCCDRPGIVGCHTRHDQRIGMTKEEANEREHRYIAKTLILLCAQGKLKVTK
jgi:hypothetical protein